MSGFYTHFMSDRAGKTPNRLFIPEREFILYIPSHVGSLSRFCPRIVTPGQMNWTGKKSFLKDYFVLTALSVGSRFVAGGWQLLVLLPLSLSLSHSIFLSLPSCLDTVVSSRLENKVLIVPTIKLDHATALFFKITNRSSPPPPPTPAAEKVSFPSRKGFCFHSL